MWIVTVIILLIILCLGLIADNRKKDEQIKALWYALDNKTAKELEELLRFLYKDESK